MSGKKLKERIRKEMTTDKTFYQYLNEWADFFTHKKCRSGYRITQFGEGYKQAVKDIFGKWTRER